MRLTPAFAPRLGLILVAALALRTAYTALIASEIETIGDALTYHLQAASLADGEFFQRAFNPQLEAASQEQLGEGAPLSSGPTAEHAPLFSLLLAGVVLLGGDGVLTQKLVMCVVGTVTVGLIGLIGRELAGERAGLIAAAIAAAYPFLWVVDGSLMSETPYGAFIAGSILLAVRFARRPTAWRGAALGALVG